jgi:hypothetical protein
MPEDSDTVVFGVFLADHGRIELRHLELIRAPGVPADELPYVFDRFWRGRQAAQISGSDIGLSAAADLARAQRPADRGQPARARHDHAPRPAGRLTPVSPVPACPELPGS